MALVIGTEQTLLQGTNSMAFVPLKDVRVDAKIVDVVAKMTVQQTYYNQEPNPIEVIYVFPLDARAAVCEFSIRIDGHLVHGGSEERVAARDTYHAAVSEGHGAFLLEQPMPDMFQINIGNLAPGEQADVTIAYLKLGDGTVDEDEFPIPTWFSPRMRQTTPAVSFLAIMERPDDAKPLGRMLTRKVPMAPAPGDYFYFGATVGSKFGKSGTRAVEEEEEEEVEQEEQEPVAAVMDRELSLAGLVAQEQERPEALKVLSRDGANTSVNLVITGGKGSAHAEASSESQAVLEEVIAKAVTEAVAEVRGGGSADATSKSLARAIGSATATAVADASVTVSLEGQGEASGLAEADATAIAKVITRAIAVATAKAVGFSVYAKGVGRAEVSETRLAKAIAEASAEATTKGGTAEASSVVVADAVVDVVAEAMATALASVADNVAKAETKSEATVDVTDEQVFVDTVDEAHVTGDSTGAGHGKGSATTSVLPGAPESSPSAPKKSSTLPIRPQGKSSTNASRPSPQKKTSTLQIGPQTSPADALPVVARPSGKKTSTLPIGPQKRPGPKTSSQFMPQPVGYPARPQTTGVAEGKEQRPPTKYSSQFPISPRPGRPGALEDRPAMKNTSNVQIRPQRSEWPTAQSSWSSKRPTGEGRFQPQSPSSTTRFEGFGQRPPSSHTGIRISTQSGGETKVVTTPISGPGRKQVSGPGYTITTSSSYFSRQRGLSGQSPRCLHEDPVAEVLDLQEADGSFRLTEKLSEVLGLDTMSALMEYNVFRASIGESNLVDPAGAEPWAIALVLELFELKMMDRKSDWEQPAFKAADLLAREIRERNFDAILSAARMYLIRLFKANEVF